jgi:ST7 protein
MYSAWDQSSKRSRIDLARKALAISPLCADAYVLLAEEEAKSPQEALAWISTDRNPTNAGSTQGIHLTREFGSDCYPK